MSEVDAPLTASLNPVTGLMLFIVYLVSFFVIYYSQSYLGEDYRRFSFLISAFVAGMLLMLFADNLLVMFVGFEGIGVFSYLLVLF